MHARFGVWKRWREPRVRTLRTALVLLAATAGFLVALSMSAHADVVEPTSAYQPASTVLLDPTSPEAAEAAEAATALPSPTAAPKIAEPATTKIDQPEVAPTPAPEQQVVRQVPTVVVPHDDHAPALADHVVHPLRIGVEHLKTSLGRVVSACEVAFGTGAGGPALVLAVLCMATPFIRRRIFAIRWATDEDAPEFRYVWELTPPG